VSEADGHRLRQTLPAEGDKAAQFCSMKITKDVRMFGAEQDWLIHRWCGTGLEAQAAAFKGEANELYLRT
jgi:hypothetical protein